jgi:sulfur carrier protein
LRSFVFSHEKGDGCRKGACARVLADLHEARAACEDQHMKVLINGEDRSFDSPISLAGLVQALGMKTDRVAVELNRDIVPRDQWEGIQLADGDRLEIVHFVGGGSCGARL